MSASTPQPPAGSRGPNRRRRLLRATALLALTSLGSLLLALVFLHTGAGRGVVERLLEKQLGPALGLELRLDALHYRLWAGALDVGGLRIAWKGGALEVAEAAARWSPRGGLALRLDRPTLVVRDGEGPKAHSPAVGLAARPWSVLDRFARVEVTAGRIELQGLDGHPYLLLDPLQATVSARRGRRTVRIALQDGFLRPSGSRTSLQSLSGRADLHLADGSLAIDALHLESEGSAADLQGTLDRLQPGHGTASVHIDADAALAALFASDLDLSGRLRAHGEIEWQGSLRGRLQASAPSLTVQGVGPWDVTLHARFDERQMELESVEARGFGGRLTARGPVALDDRSPTDLELRAAGVDAARLAQAASLARAAAGARLPIRSSLQATLRWKTTGLELERAHGRGQVALQPLAASMAPPEAATPGLPLSGATRLVLDGRRLQLRELRLESRGLVVTGNLALSPSAGLRGAYRAELPLESLPSLAADLGAGTELPPLVGRLVAEGEVGGRVKEPLATLRLRGEGVSTASIASVGSATLAAEGAYVDGRLRFDSLAVHPTGGGRALLSGEVPLAEGAGDWDLHGEIQAFDLAPLLAAVGVEGRGPLDGGVTLRGPRARPALRADLGARITLAGATKPMVVTLRASSAASRLVAERFEARLAGGRVGGEGSFDLRSGAIEAKAEAEGMRLASLPLVPTTLRGLDGTLAAELTLAGSLQAPAGELRASLSEVRLAENPLPGLALTARADGQRFDLVATSPDPDGTEVAPVILRGGGPLRDDWPLRLDLDVAALPLQAVLDAIPTLRERGSALTARGLVTVDLPLRRPARLRYASDTLAANGRLQDIEWQVEPFRVEGALEEASVSGLRLAATSSSPASRSVDRRRTSRRGSDAPEVVVARVSAAPAPADTTPATETPTTLAGATLAIDGRLALAPTRRSDLTVLAQLDLAALRHLADGPVAGTADLRLRVRGTSAEPDLQGELSLTDVRGRSGSTWLSGVQLLARLQGDRAHVERLEARLLGGELTASGAVPLRPLPADATTRLRFEASDLDLSRLAFPGVQREIDAPSFLVSLVGDLDAAAPDLGAIRGRGSLTRVEEQSPEGRIALAEPAGWTLAGGHFELAPMRLVGALGTLEARAEARLATPFTGTAAISGPFDLRMVSPFLPDTTLSGPARVELQAGWDPKGVRLDGSLRVENGRLTLEPLAFSVTQLEGEVRLLGDRATVNATAASGDGRLQLSGGMRFGARLLGPAELRLDAQRLPIGYPEGFRARADGTIELSGEPGGYGIEGKVDLRQAYYTAEFDQKQQSVSRLERQLAALQGEVSIGEHLPLSVRVQFREPLRIRNSRAQLDVVGGFTATGTLEQPTAAGQVSLFEGGQIRIRRGDVRVQQGRVELNGYPEGEPELDLAGISQIAGIEMDVRAHGTFEDLQLDISSPNRPDLSQTDLVSLLLTGRTAQTAAAQSTAIVAEELASALGGVLQKSVGEMLLFDVGPDRSLLTDDVDPTQRFSLGARLRQNLVVLYSARLDGTEHRWIVDWNPGGGPLRLRAMDDEGPGLSFEIAHRVSFDVFRRRDPAARPAMRERRRLAALRIEGELPVPRQKLMRVAGLRVGRAESALRREQAADVVRERLVEAGWLSATVDTESAPAPNDPDAVELTLRVEAGPRIRATWTGDEPGGKVQAKALASWPSYASPESAAAVVARTARVLLQAEGYYLAKVDYELRPHGKETELLLQVERGPKGRGVSLGFEGNTVLDDGALRAALPRPGSREFFEALAGRGRRLSAALRIAYARVGHLRTRPRRPRSTFDPATRRLHVVIPIREREAALVSELVLPPELSETDADAPRLSLRAGRPFDLDAYIADRDAIAAWYRGAGWIEARVLGALEPANGDLRVRFEAAAGPRLRAGKIHLVSHGRSNPALVRRAVVVAPGAPVRPQALAESRARLSELGIFRSVDVRPLTLQEIEGQRRARAAKRERAGLEGPPPADPDAGRQEGDIVVSFVERPDVTFEYGLRYSTSGAAGVGEAPSSLDDGRLQLAGALELTNPFGWGWHLRPYALLTTDRHSFGTALTSATLFGLRLRTQLLVFDDDNRRSASSLASRIRGLSLQQTRALLENTSAEGRRERLRLQWSFASKSVQYFDKTGLETGLAGKRSYLGLSLVGDERDSLTDPHRGHFWTASAEMSHQAIGSDVNYLRLYGQLFLYLPLPGQLVWAQGYRVGVAPGDDLLLLLENRFQAGGPTTVRGYAQNDLGPQMAVGAGIGGQGLLIVNQELRFPIWRFLTGGVFWDAGNVWERAGDLRLGDLRQSVGAGLRVMLPFGPIRAEYAWNVGKNRGGSRGRFVLGIGHAF